MKSVSILGCGWLGLPLAEHLIQKDYTVKGTTTSAEKLINLEEKGITPFLMNIDALTPFDTFFFESEILIIAIPSKNTDGFQRLIAEIEKSSLQKIIFISSTSVYPSLNRVVVEEDVDTTKPLAIIEAFFQRNKKFETTVIRFGGLFGGNRHPGNWFRNGRKIPHPKGFVNMIHQKDCIAIIEEVIKQEVWKETFSACSPHHPIRRDFYTKAKTDLGFELPEFEENLPLQYKIVSPKKLIQKLNYRFTQESLFKLKED